MFIIWPEYFDSTLSRSNGRRMPASLSVHGANAEELYSIAKKLGLSPVLENDKTFPSRWTEGKGRIKVPKKYDKTRTLRMIAEALVRKHG